jgi:DNA-binding CsgD family transcriptional regulator
LPVSLLRVAAPEDSGAVPLMNLFDRLAVGVALIDRRCTALMVNAAFHAAGGPDLFRVEEGRLRIFAPYRRTFEERVEKVFRGETVRPLYLGELQGDLAVVLQGLGEPEEAGPATAMVALLDLRRGAPEAQWVSTLYGLTPSERRVLQAIAAGDTVEEAAETLQVSVSTVRTHLHRVYSKTRTGTQAALVRLVHLLPIG